MTESNNNSMVDINSILNKILQEVQALKKTAEDNLRYYDGARDGAILMAQRLIEDAQNHNQQQTPNATEPKETTDEFNNISEDRKE